MKQTKFYNGDLQTDAGKHLRADNIVISKSVEKNDTSKVYYLDINDNSYFYYSQSERDFDFANAKRLFTKNLKPCKQKKTF